MVAWEKGKFGDLGKGRMRVHGLSMYSSSVAVNNGTQKRFKDGWVLVGTRPKWPNSEPGKAPDEATECLSGEPPTPPWPKILFAQAQNAGCLHQVLSIFN